MEHMILRDEDGSTVMEGGWKKINTLRHYWVKNNAIFRLRARKDHAPPGRSEWALPSISEINIQSPDTLFSTNLQYTLQ